MSASAWYAPAATLIIAAAITGQQIRTPELVASARELDTEAWHIVPAIPAGSSAGADGYGRAFS